ncbi:ferric uptake regulator, Fur family [Desulfatibacillum aliphaticivorans]|uniref:Ferric uptake regulator, Fur family n=1 Tax=Desulfatibacillum aliphaticivorans TaxID=218208 RepID=B8FDS2_DESAL|nr:transcriptional repressor [Desulfatibacillum aliphaticivorans]ACL06703.1 ferric uptake regulator, Fur family [Desulfatibacillum aliphaticivorans]
MEISFRETNERMARFEKAISEAGVKKTIQRLEIFREIASSVDHPDVETVYERVRERLPTVSLDTVYRTMWMLLDLGLISTLGASRDRTRFDANMENHHHFVCSRCGLTRDFYSEELDGIKIPESVKDFGSINKAHLEVVGICKQCAAKPKPIAQKEDTS